MRAPGRGPPGSPRIRLPVALAVLLLVAVAACADRVDPQGAAGTAPTTAPAATAGSPGASGVGDAGADAPRVPAATAEPGGSAGPAGLRATLDGVAAAMRAGDPSELRAFLADPTSPFGQRWLARARNLAAVPLSHYRLRLDPSLPDLATAGVRQRHGRDARVVYVVEEHALAGFDSAGPAQDDLFLTVVPTPEGWRVAGDDDAEILGLPSADHLWDHGPVVATRHGPVLLLHHPGTEGLQAVAREAVDAVAEVQGRWPLSWEGRAVLVVPDDEAELSELLHATFDVTEFVAFATASPTGELGAFHLTGPRVIVNPDRFLNRSPSFRRSILAHELLHVATRSHAGPFVPSWLEEGVAQRLGEEGPTTGTALLEQRVAAGGFGGDLPEDSEFVTGGRERIFLSYQLAYSFLDFLVDTRGAEAVGRLYAAAGRGAVGEPGRQSWHVRRAVREVFGQGLEDLRAAWVEHLTAS